MPDNVITNIEQVTTEWLTAALAASGALTRGAVASFELGAGQGNWSSNARLNVKYTDGAQGSLPGRLFLKMVNTDLGDQSFDASEVMYYRRDYVDVADAPLLRCYDAEYSEDLGGIISSWTTFRERTSPRPRRNRHLPMGWRLQRASLLCMPAGGVDNGWWKQGRPCTAQATFGISSRWPNLGLVISAGDFRLS